jgi:hypothetical protein
VSTLLVKLLNDGFITDSKALGLEMANVMAVNQGTKKPDYAEVAHENAQ